MLEESTCCSFFRSSVALSPDVCDSALGVLFPFFFFWAFFYLTLVALGTGLAQTDMLAISIGALALSPPSAATQPGLFHGSVVVPLVAVGFDEVILIAYAIVLHVIEMFWITLLALWGLATTGISLSALLDQRLSERPESYDHSSAS